MSEPVALVIPARSDSKRIPRKNVQVLGTWPLVEWTISFAKNSGLFSRIFVSSDDPEVLKVASKYEVISWRRTESVDDFATVSDVVMDVLDNQEQDLQIDNWAVMLPTCPFRSITEAEMQVQTFLDGGKRRSLMTCVEALGFQPAWAFKLDEGGQATRIAPESWSRRSQDLPSLYMPSGNFWISTRHLLKRDSGYHGPETSFFPISFVTGFDIDSPADMAFARKIVGGFSGEFVPPSDVA